MRTFVQKQKPRQQTKPADSTTHGRPFSAQNHAIHSILHLQRTAGNKAVLRMFKEEEQASDPILCNASKSDVGHDFSRISVHDDAEKPQTNLMMSKPGDKYEQEADAIAKQVVQKSAHYSTPAHLQQNCTTCESDIPLKHQTMEEKEETLQMTSGAGGTDIYGISASVYTQIQQSRGGGQSMDLTILETMNDAFQADFSPVRIHTDQQSVKMNQQLNARAFTHGNDIYFNQHQYKPESVEGKRLLAHELTHVIQQGAVQSILQRTGQGGPQLVDTYTVEQTIRLLDLAFSMVPRALEDTEIPQSRKQRIRRLEDRLRTLYEQLERARGSDGSGIIPEFDITPEANEINPGDADKGITDLYSPFSVSAPTTPTPQTSAPELQPKLDSDRSARISQIPLGQNLVQRVFCGGPCTGIVVLAGLLLSGCSRSSSAPMNQARLEQARTTFGNNHGHLNDAQTAKVDRALSATAGNNIPLLIAYYEHYSDYQLLIAAGEDAERFRGPPRIGAETTCGWGGTRPTDVMLNPDNFESSVSDSRLGGVLFHEFLHASQCGGRRIMPHNEREAAAHGVEYFFAERNGDTDRMREIYRENYLHYRGFQWRFHEFYGTMKVLYDVIDRGASSYIDIAEQSGSYVDIDIDIAELSEDEARAHARDLTAELMTRRPDQYSEELNDIMLWVRGQRRNIGPDFSQFE